MRHGPLSIRSQDENVRSRICGSPAFYVSGLYRIWDVVELFEQTHDLSVLLNCLRCSSVTWIQFLAFMHGWRREMDNCMWLIWIALMEHMWTTKESDLELLLLFSLEAMWHLVSFHFLIPLLFQNFLSIFKSICKHMIVVLVVFYSSWPALWHYGMIHFCTSWLLFSSRLAMVVNFMKMYQFKLRGL